MPLTAILLGEGGAGREKVGGGTGGSRSIPLKSLDTRFPIWMFEYLAL